MAQTATDPGLPPVTAVPFIVRAYPADVSAPPVDLPVLGLGAALIMARRAALDAAARYRQVKVIDGQGMAWAVNSSPWTR